MKWKEITWTVVLILLPWAAVGQRTDSSSWVFTAEVNGYYFNGETLVLPIFQADHNRLHLEARYNYEDFRTFSGWVGYNFIGGNKLGYKITPMIGVATGQTKGITAGIEMEFTMGRFEFYTETEYLNDMAGKENNFLYTWTDFTWSPADWWWIGLSGQHTRLYQTEVEILHGLLVGAGKGDWEFSLYAYNVELTKPLFILTIDFAF